MKTHMQEIMERQIGSLASRMGSGRDEGRNERQYGGNDGKV
jgi:hypothetical protein